METIILVIHVFVAIGLIGLIMLQQGKGADAGASFGAGASQTVFGSSGSGNFLSHTTAILATVFFLSSIGLAVIARDKANDLSTSSELGIPGAVQQQSVPTIPAASSDVPVLDDIGVDSSETPVVVSAPSSEGETAKEEAGPVESADQSAASE